MLFGAARRTIRVQVHALSCALLAAFAAGACRDRNTLAPPARAHGETITAVGATSRGNLSGGSVTVTVKSNDASGTASFGLDYGNSPVLVDIVMNGSITRTHLHTQGTITFGPSGYQNCSWALTKVTWTWAYGSTSWWPTCSDGVFADTVRTAIRGTAVASRSSGQTTCTGYSGQCFSYSGSGTVSITPVDGQLWMNVDTVKSYPHTLLLSNGGTDYHSFYASSNVPSGYVFVGSTAWTFQPDSGSVTTVCVGSGNPCAYPVSRSGTMRVTATVNGTVKAASMRIIVECLVSGPPQDSAFRRIANDTLTRQLLQLAWDSSHVTATASLRRERIGYWNWTTATPPARIRQFNYVLTSGDTLNSPCSSWFAPTGVNSDSERVFLHTHPFTDYEHLPAGCGGRYDGRTNRGLSPNDIYANQAGYPREWGVMADRDSVVVYRIPPGFPRDSLLDHGHYRNVVPRGADVSPYARRYSRRASPTSCQIYTP